MDPLPTLEVVKNNVGWAVWGVMWESPIISTDPLPEGVRVVRLCPSICVCLCVMVITLVCPAYWVAGVVSLENLVLGLVARGARMLVLDCMDWCPKEWWRDAVCMLSSDSWSSLVIY